MYFSQVREGNQRLESFIISAVYWFEAISFPKVFISAFAIIPQIRQILQN
jgi:hypothetical protein